ncbi:hypothetical protein D3C86_1351640 [compost metagenome]
MLATAQGHVGGRHFAQSRVGHADHLGQFHAWVFEQHLLDLQRRNVLPAHPEHVLEPANETQAAIDAHLPQITGMQPA